ncbi:hypothetical protein AVEN_132784-1, partial [Araneus ventricosus]
MENIEENKEEIISKISETVSTMSETSYGKSSTVLNIEEVFQKESDTEDNKSYLSNDNFKELHQDLSIGMLEMNVEKTYYNDNIKSKEILADENFLLRPSEANSITDVVDSNDSELMRKSSGVIMPRNFQYYKSDGGNLLDICNLNSTNEVLSYILSNVSDSEDPLPPTVPSSPQKTVPDFQNIGDIKNESLEKFSVSRVVVVKEEESQCMTDFTDSNDSELMRRSSGNIMPRNFQSDKRDVGNQLDICNQNSANKVLSCIHPSIKDNDDQLPSAVSRLPHKTVPRLQNIGDVKNEILEKCSASHVVVVKEEESQYMTDFAGNNVSDLMKKSSGNIKPRTSQCDKCDFENLIDVCNLNYTNQVLSNIPQNISDSEDQLPPTAPNSPHKTVQGLKNVDDIKVETLGKFSLSPRIIIKKEGSESNSADNLKSGFVSEAVGHVNPISARDNIEINGKKKFSKKTHILSKNIQGVSTIPLSIENNPPDTINSKKFSFDSRLKSKPKVSMSPSLTNTWSHNLGSSKNNLLLKTNHKYRKESSKIEVNKHLSLKEKVKEKKKVREQKMTITHERREDLEKSRREKLLLDEERRKRFETNEYILKRKIMDVKNEAKRIKLSKQFAISSEASPQVNSEPQSSQTGLNHTYLAKNLKDLSPVEPTENAQVSSNGNGLNYALLYSSTYDKKIFLKQSVVLSDIAQMMPAGTIQNCINLSQNKEIKRICKSNNLSKIKPPVVARKTYSCAPIKHTGQVENRQDHSSGEGLNYSLLYSSVYDRKIFMKQSVVLSDIAQLMPAGTIQNCINFYQNNEMKPILNRKPNSITDKVREVKLSAVAKKNSFRTSTKRQTSSTRKISVAPNINKKVRVKNRRLLKNYLTTRKQERIGKVLKENDTQCVKSMYDQDRKGIFNSNSVKVEEIIDSVEAKLPLYETTKGNDAIAMIEELRRDQKISVEPYVVIENLSNSEKQVNVYPEIKISNAEKKEKSMIISSNTNNSDPKLSVLRPVVVLKDITNIKSNHSRLTDVKRVKVSVLDNGMKNHPKLSTLKPGIVLKDIINSKSSVQTVAKKVNIRISPSNAINNEPMSSVLGPDPVLKDERKIKSNESRLKDDKPKRMKVSVLDNDMKNDPKLSTLKPGIVLKDTISSKSCVHTVAKKLKSGISSSNVISNDPKSSVLSPVPVLKNIKKIKSNESRLTHDKSKRTKVSILDNVMKNDPKLSTLKPGIVLKDIISGKSYAHTVAKQVNIGISPSNAINNDPNSSVLSPVPVLKDIKKIKSNKARLTHDKSKRTKVSVLD